jgi:magnesium chelatase family protein
LTAAEIERVANARPPAIALLAKAVPQRALSARGYHRVLKLARTIADLACVAPIEPAHMAEALGYRREPGVG